MPRVLSEERLATRYTHLGAAMAETLRAAALRETTTPAHVPQGVYAGALRFFRETIDGVNTMQGKTPGSISAMRHWSLASTAVMQTLRPPPGTYDDVHGTLRRFDAALQRMAQPYTPTDEERTTLLQLADFFAWITKKGGETHYREFMDASCGHLGDDF